MNEQVTKLVKSWQYGLISAEEAVEALQRLAGLSEREARELVSE